MIVACLDLEGVLIPEIWINIAKETKIEDLLLTTRDIPNYDTLMQHRLKVIKEHGLNIYDIQKIISSIKPLDGAVEFLKWLQSEFQVIILSDTFYEFALPIMKYLDYPTLFCHNLVISPKGEILNYKLRLNNQKQEAVKRFKELNFKTISSGDSYNDITMLQESDFGILFCPSKKVMEEFTNFPVTNNYEKLKNIFIEKRNIINKK